MSREESLARLETLNRELEEWEVEPLFSVEAIANLSDHGLAQAVEITENYLMGSARKLAEQ